MLTMIKLKTGGLIVTGFTAFLIAGKVINSMNSSVSKICEAAKWRGYYKCWSEGKASGEPIAPGYSVTTRPIGADYEVVKDPEGKDHSKEGAPDIPKEPQSMDVVNAIIGAVKDVTEKAIDSLNNRVKRKEEALEAQIEASESDILAQTEETPDTDTINVIEGLFEEEMDISSSEDLGTDVKEKDE